MHVRYFYSQRLKLCLIHSAGLLTNGCLLQKDIQIIWTKLFFEKGAHNQIMPRVVQFVCNLQKNQKFCEII